MPSGAAAANAAKQERDHCTRSAPSPRKPRAGHAAAKSAPASQVRKLDKTLQYIGKIRIVHPGENAMRRTLLATAGLQLTVSFVWGLSVQAQPAPDARPLGGTVAAGVAAISQTTERTDIQQSSPRAVIDWKSFDVGSHHTVEFNQPSKSAIILNRVTGPNPSQIAGRIAANGQVVLVNQAGVTFYRGAQVNTAGLMVSAAGITDGNFMRGRMKFDQPASPQARVENQGMITVNDTGLAALVAPQVANSGTITAKLGHVVLAGAKTATLDLYGDGLLSIDVSDEVTQAPNGVTALVTNTGVIRADGGTVELTARAVDGIVQNLISAGGQINAPSASGRQGAIVLDGVGGSVIVQGQLSASGDAPGSLGGKISVTSDRDVAIENGARIDASGSAGGGVAAIGTTLVRAEGGAGVSSALTAENVAVERGATISADAMQAGNGGRIVILASGTAEMAGNVSARGGAAGGNGGYAEISGTTVGITGKVDLSAPLGTTGLLLLDPLDLYVADRQPSAATYTVQNSDLPNLAADSAPDNATISWVSPSVLEGLQANVSLSASRNLFVASSADAPNTLNLGDLTLTLSAGNDLSVDRGFTISAAAISLAAGRNISLGAASGVAAGLISVTQLAALPQTSLQLTTYYSGGITLAAGGNAALSDAVLGNQQIPLGSLDISSGGDVTQSTSGQIFSYYLGSSNGIGGSASFLGTGNQISDLGSMTVGGNLQLIDSTDLSDYARVTAANIVFEIGSENGGNALWLGGEGQGGLQASAGGRISLAVDALYVQGGASTISAPRGTVELAPRTTGTDITFSEQQYADLIIDQAVLQAISPATATLRIGRISAPNSPLAANIIFGEPVDLTGIAQTIDLAASGGVTQYPGATLTAPNLSGSVGSVNLGAANMIGNLRSFSATGELSIVNSQMLTISGTVSSGGPLSFNISGSLSETGGALSAPSLSINATSATLNGANQVGDVGAVAVTGGFAMTDGEDLTISGPVSAGPSLAFDVNGNLGIRGDIFSAGTLELRTQGGIVRSAGELNAGILTGHAGSAVDLGTGAFVSALGSFAVDSGSFAIADLEPLTITGTLSAAAFDVSATAQLTFSGSINTQGGALSQQLGPNPAPGGSTLEVLSSPEGGSARFVQTGSATIEGSARPTVRIQLPAQGGTASFAGLTAPRANLVLALGTGSATGIMQVGGLAVLARGGSATSDRQHRGRKHTGRGRLGADQPVYQRALYV